MSKKNLYIPSIDAKDIYLSNHSIVPDSNGYHLQKKDGTLNLTKFINSFDYSLDLIELRRIADEIYKNHSFSFKLEHKEYSSKIINVTFNYSNKEFNRVCKNTFVKFGYLLKDLVFEDNVCIIDDSLVGIIVDTPTLVPISLQQLSTHFTVSKLSSGETIYQEKKIKTLHTVAKLRESLYTTGFYCDGTHYVRFKRSSGSSRVGKCLFIDEKLSYAMEQFAHCGVDIQYGQPIDLAAWEAYISLSTSSIIDTLTIEPQHILVIDDYCSTFEDEAVVTSIGEDSWLTTTQQNVTIHNSIWDGQSLIDISVMQAYDRFGMVLLRNKFFKSCCFNTNLQQWFQDNHIHSIEQLNGYTLAKDIKDIKLVTTPNSIKYTKFGTIHEWLNNIPNTFGIVKHDKRTHYFDGDMVQAHYQLINTLQLNQEEVDQLLAPSLDYVNKLHTNLDVFRYHIKCTATDNKQTKQIKSKNDMFYTMLHYDCGFERTKLFYEYKKEICKSYLKNLKKGHVLIHGTYATLFGNPYEMLLSCIHKFDGTSSLAPGTVHNTKYPYGESLLGCRSPHVCMGNILITKNVAHDLIDQYFNLTNEIICINSIRENILERLSGADFDSDQMIITNDTLLIQAALKNYNIFKVPTSKVDASKTQRYYTCAQLADLDIKTSGNKIGEIINTSQELNTLLWSQVNKSNSSTSEYFKQIKELYYDICQLDVMSCIEIDKAKKEFKINTTKELKKIKEKYCITNQDGRTVKPNFFGFIAKTKGYYNADKNSYQQHDTSMDYLFERLNKYRSKKTKASDFLPLSEIFKPESFNKSSVNWIQINKIIELLQGTKSYIDGIWCRNQLPVTDQLELSELVKQNACDVINKLKLNNDTLYTLLTYVDNDKFSSISRLLFLILYNYKNSILINLIRDKKQVDSFLTRGTNQGTIDLYGIHFESKEV